MKILTFLLLLALSIPMSLNAKSEKTNLGEQPLNAIHPDYVLTTNDFMRINKIIPIQRVSDICMMRKEVSRYFEYIKRIKFILNQYQINIEDFKQSGFVNIECYDGNFAYEAMEESPDLFQLLIDFGINFNRPITYKGKVGTFLDIALYRVKELSREDVAILGTSIRKLKKLNFKTCKELGIKCSLYF